MTPTLSEYQIVAQIDLDYWTTMPYSLAQQQLINQLQTIHQDVYEQHQRIVFTQTRDLMVVGDFKSIVLSNLLVALNDVDISSYFIIVMSTNPDIAGNVAQVQHLSNDDIPITTISMSGNFEVITIEKFPTSKKEIYQYGSANPIKINLDQLSSREQYLLSESKKFCMYPWVHLHAWPTGQAFPCCMSEPAGQIGDCRTQKLDEIWNSTEQKQLRVNMLNEVSSAACTRCYEQEESGFFSGRQSANKHHGHHINKVQATTPDGNLEKFELTYWDIRFSNLCNLSCRSCGHIFSSSWYQDQAKLAGGDWKQKNKVLNYAGRTETDIWEQLEPHLDYVEQIYFAGGEPLLMEEHYRILDELVKRKRFDVRLIYNTNFTHTDLKGRSVFEYWKQFDSVAVGASLDDAGPRAEYIRKGTNWAVIENNRQEMLAICPDVDFYISPTLSIMNAWSMIDFHQDWVKKGLIKPQDINVNILQDPPHYRIDIAPVEYKEQLAAKFADHIAWLQGQDSLQRATTGFESAVKFMMATDNTHLIDTFWRKTHELDSIRKENVLDVIPELAALK
jgi:organic radical activating enzyme